ncbi:MAG: 5-oxoprolinase subunit PxpB [Desulfobacula sp.]|nr:5-oxoprolinase subunit PxpB [Desulfobacula sp.]
MGQIFKKPRMRLMGDSGLLFEYGDVIDPEVNQKVKLVAKALDQEMPLGVSEVMPTYRSILMIYNPVQTNPDVLARHLDTLKNKLEDLELPPSKTIDIPVCYGEKHGPELPFVAEHTGLSEKEIIKIHSGSEYQIFMIGFTPGFPFLGGMDDRLTTPRLKTPRTLVPAGSVGIANNQTGIYPVDSPGGWQLIGRTPLRLFSPEKKNPFLYAAGDKIRFKPVDQAEFDRLNQIK